MLFPVQVNEIVRFLRSTQAFYVAFFWRSKVGNSLLWRVRCMRMPEAIRVARRTHGQILPIAFLITF